MPSTKSKREIHPLESPVGEDAMVALARFRLLTIPQLLAVTGRDEKTLRSRVRQLVARQYVHCHPFYVGHMSGKLPSAYSLTQKGANWIGGELGTKPKPYTGTELALSQYQHRTFIRDALIAADKWARKTDQTVTRFRMDKEGPESALKLPMKTVNPDGVIELNDSQGIQRSYIVEVYCQQRGAASSKPYEKLPPYMAAMFTGALDAALGIVPDEKHVRGVRVLCVFDSPEYRDRIMRSLPERGDVPPLTSQTWQRFHFKSVEEVADFGIGWHRVNQTPIELPI